VKGRKVCNVAGEGALHLKLQWGRPCEGAERARSLCGRIASTLLQWGRPCEGAESLGHCIVSLPCSMLQWGRPCEGAERTTI